MTITLSSTVFWRDSLLSTPVDQQFVVMDMEGGKFFDLDRIAAAVWHRIEHPISVADLCAKCVADFDGDPTVIEGDILRLLATLATHGLVTIKE